MNMTMTAPFPDPTRRILFGRDPRWTLARVLLWSFLALVFFHYYLVPIRIVGYSMDPTYHDGAVNFINRAAYVRRIPQRGDVIALRDGNDVLLKRIIGLPGETVSIERGRIRINGKALADQFSLRVITEDMNPVTLEPDEFFFIGDNREISDFGKVAKPAILGRIVF